MKRAVSILMLALFLVSCGSEAIKQERTEAIKRAREKRASNTAPSSKFVPEAQETNTKFNWKTNQSINPLDDSVTVVAFLNAWQGTGGLSDELISLVARCKSNKTEVYVTWHDYLGLDDTSVTYRFPPSEAVNERWGLSTDNQATFVKQPIRFLKTLVANGKKLVIRTIPYNESPSIATFDLEGAHRAIQPISETCNWTLPGAPEE